MSWLSGFVRKQGQLVLHHDLYALFNTVIWVILPYTGWLAGSVIALVTLRKGMKAGALLLIPALIAYFIVLKTTLPVSAAVIGCLLSYVPCYIAALALRVSKSWRVVFCVLFLLIVLAMCLLHSLLPEFITQQYLYLREILNQLQLEKTVSWLNKNANSAEQRMFANYLVGLQATGVAISTLISLVFARFIQSLLYLPGGFKQEMRSLRATKRDVLVFVVTLLGAKQQVLLAMNLIPILAFFFFLVGLSLWLDCMVVRVKRFPMLILTVVLGFFPHVMLSICVLLGVLDTWVNFRLYLPNGAGKVIREGK